MSGAAAPGGGQRPLLRLAHRVAFALGLAGLGLLTAAGIYQSAQSERGLPGIFDPSGPHLGRLFAQGDYEQVARELRAALALDPLESWERHYQLGLALSRKGDLDAAIEELERAARLVRRQANVHQALGEALGARGDEARAREELARATELRLQVPRGPQPGSQARY